MAFNELLIDMVKEHPCLYNSQIKDYRDKLRKENSWKDISSKLNQPVEFCMKRWIILRDRFAKEKRKMESVRSGSGATRYSYWEHFQSMEFLKDHIKHRITSTNFSPPEGAIIHVEMDDSESVLEQNDGQSSSSSVIEPSPDVCSASTSVLNLCASGSGDKTFNDDCWLSVHKKSFVCSDTPTIKRKKQSMGDLKDNILKTVAEVGRSSEAIAGMLSRREMTQCQAFGQMVAARLRAMPAEKAESVMSHPIHRRHELPDVKTDQVQKCLSEEIVLQSHQVTSHALPSRAPPKKSLERFASQKKENNKNFEGFCEESYEPVGNGFLYCRPTRAQRLSGAVSSSTDDGYETPTTGREPPARNRRKKVPTLKRKVSEWEKEAIKQSQW